MAQLMTIVLLAGGIYLGTLSAQEKTPEVQRVQQEEWSCKVVIRAKNTRSEGWTGFLSKDGQAILGKKPGEVIDTPIGRFMWFGKSQENDALFRNRGWLNNLPYGKNAFDGEKRFEDSQPEK